MQSTIEKLGENLKIYRKKKQLTISDLATKLNIGKSTISSWENGRHAPDIDTINKIADILEVSIDTLLGRTKPVKAKNIEIINGHESIYTTADYLIYLLDQLKLSNLDEIEDVKISIELIKKTQKKRT